MTLQASGVITMQDIANELGISSSGLSLNDSRVRTLAGVSSGAISFANLYGKSNNKPVASFSISLSWDTIKPTAASGSFTLGANGTVSCTHGGSTSAYWYGPNAVTGIGSSYWYGMNGVKTSLASLSSGFSKTYSRGSQGRNNGSETLEIYSDSAGNTKVCSVAIAYDMIVETNQ